MPGGSAPVVKLYGQIGAAMTGQTLGICFTHRALGQSRGCDDNPEQTHHQGDKNDPFVLVILEIIHTFTRIPWLAIIGAM